MQNLSAKGMSMSITMKLSEYMDGDYEGGSGLGIFHADDYDDDLDYVEGSGLGLDMFMGWSSL